MFLCRARNLENCGSCEKALEGTDSEILPEIHENYFIQKKLEEKNVYTYDFQLPMLILNAVYFGRTLYLKDWMKLCPRKQFTTLDTHDGIGVVDVRYLMPMKKCLQQRKRCLMQIRTLQRFSTWKHKSEFLKI